MSEWEVVARLSASELWKAAADGLALVDDQGRIVATNSAFNELFGYAKGGDLLGQPIEVLVPVDHREAHERDRAGYHQAPTPRSMAASAQLQGLRADGSTFAVSVSLAPMEVAGEPVTFAAARDVSQAVERDAQLALVNRQRMIAEDHDRIASELHDTTIQRLFALGLGLQGLPAQIQDQNISERIESAVDTLDDVIREIRSTIHGLRRIPVSGVSLRQRVLGLVAEMEPVIGFSPHIQFSGDIDAVTSEDIIGHLLPVLREGLSNIAKHARATSATVNVSVADNLMLEVIDNGEGVKDNVIRSGLANMADRAVALSGSFEIEAGIPSGTLLRWTVPHPS